MSEAEALCSKSAEQLAREQIQREILEAVAKHLERKIGNEVYRWAWKAAAKDIRAMKPA